MPPVFIQQGKRKKAVRADSLFPKRVDKNVEKER